MKNQQKNFRGISRRKFITTIGLAAGASSISAFIPLLTNGKQIDKRTHLKLGLLLPTSTLYPQMGANLQAGMQLYFDHFNAEKSGQRIDLFVEEIGVSPRRALQKARKLIEESQVDLLAGLLDPAVCHDLGTLCAEKQTFMVASQVGANIVRAHDHNPFIIHNSLGYWQSNWAMGNWAANNIGKRALVSASFFESGYDALYAFNLGFESAGGQVILTCIDNHDPQTKCGTDLLSAIHRHEPDLVFASYHGDQSVRFLKNYRKSALADRIPLLASGFMMDDPALVNMGEEAAGIRSCLPWSAALDKSGNIYFRNEFNKQYGYAADIFAVLGFDTAHLIAQTLDAADGNLRNIPKIKNAFAAAQFNRPDGPLSKETDLPDTPFALYLRAAQSLDGQLSNRIITKLSPDKGIKQDIRLTQSAIKTGFLNPYLCA